MNARPDMSTMSNKLSAAARESLVCRYRDAIREQSEAIHYDAWMLRELALQGSEKAIELYIRDMRLVVLELIAINKMLKYVIDWKLPDTGAVAK